MFNRWVELALFHDTALFSQAVSKLEAAGIPYKVKDQSIGPKDRRTGSLGGSSRFNTLPNLRQKGGFGSRPPRPPLTPTIQKGRRRTSGGLSIAQ